MLTKLAIGWALMALSVAIHAGGVTSALRWARRQSIEPDRFWAWTWLFVCLAAWVILLHLLEIVAWGFLYVWRGAIPDVQSALYFSAVTYTTTGYGDIGTARRVASCGRHRSAYGDPHVWLVHRVLHRCR